MNQVIYSQLSVATVVGTDHHLLKIFEDMKDRNASWKSICEWYDGYVIKNDTIEWIMSNTRDIMPPIIIKCIKLHKQLPSLIQRT